MAAVPPPTLGSRGGLRLVPRADYQLGVTKMFLKAGKGKFLEDLKERPIDEVLPVLRASDTFFWAVAAGSWELASRAMGSFPMCHSRSRLSSNGSTRSYVVTLPAASTDCT